MAPLKCLAKETTTGPVGECRRECRNLATRQAQRFARRAALCDATYGNVRILGLEWVPHLGLMLRTFLLETRIGHFIVTLIILGLGALLIYFAASYGLSEYAHLFDR